MSCYISSSNNRFYAATEPAFGVAPELQSKHRIPAVRLKARQENERVQRRDKTGSRTWAGLPPGIRTKTTFGLNTYMTAWSDPTREPAHGALIGAAMGAPPLLFGGGIISSASGTHVVLASAHGLSPGQAIAAGGEIRFVASIPDPTSVHVNVPFSAAIATGAVAGPTATYKLATNLPSVSIFDYWSPDTAVQRLVSGCAVDKFSVQVNGDFHEFGFSGAAADLIDSSSFSTGQAGLTQFPAEPDTAGFDYTIIPGHLGEAWIGSIPTQFFTITTASVQVENAVDLRASEFGSNLARCFSAGLRKVTADITVFANDEDETKSLYQAARQFSPVSMMLQLGDRARQLFGVYLRAVVPVVPEFDDTETRLQWTFKGSRAQGVSDDEIIVAFA